MKTTADARASADDERSASDTPAADARATTQGVRRGSWALTVVAVLAVLYTMYFAREFLIPITFAFLLRFVFEPPTRWLGKLRLPRAAASGIVVLGLTALLTYGVYALSGAVQKWATSAPEAVATAERKLRGLIRPIQRVTSSAEKAAKAATEVTGSSGVPEVVVREPSFGAQMLDKTKKVLAGTVEAIILLYFLLAAGDLFLQKLIKVLPRLRDKRKAVRIAREMQSSISTYLVTLTVVNVAEGVIVAVAMWLLGMPNPVLWGALAMLAEFVPYLGALAMVLILTAAALTTFDSVGHALLVPATFLVLNVVQANLATPLLYGHRLSLNPVAVLLGLAFWFWVWGIPGAFIAVPLMATFKICCDHIEGLSAVGEFLGTKDNGENGAASQAA
jgi:predicted PurR-regulated permease PerM